MKFYRQSDLESRVPYIKKELERRGIEDEKRQKKIINICNEQDPSGNLAKYTLWIIKQFLNGEDIKDCKNIISEYETLVKKKKMPESKRDINKLSLESLKDIVDGSSDITNTVPKDYGRHIRKIDSDDDLTLYLVDDFETAKYLWGKNTSWCITQEAYWDDYTYDGEYPDFYCIYKNGKPYTLLHCEGKQDIEMTEDTAPTDEELLEIAPILLKNKVPYVDEYNPITLKRLGINEVNALSEDYKKSFIPESDDDMEKAFQAIMDKLITKEEDKEIFEQILNKFDAEYSYKLLYKGIITSNDGELFELVLKKLLESNRYLGNLLSTRTITNKDGGIFKQIVKNFIEQYSGYAYDLLKAKIVTRSDGELFDEVLEKAIEYSYHAYELLSEKIITKEDGEIFNRVLKKVLEDSGWASMLLSEKTITKSDGEIFNNVLEKVIGDSEKAYNLLSKKIIKKEDREIFNKVVEKAIENPKSAYYLLDKKIITVSDGEIFDKVVEKLSEYSGWASSLLENGIIKKEDGELYDKVLEKALENSYFAYNSLREGTITRSDGELFRKAVEAATEYSDNAYWLLKGKKITKSDVPPDLWEKILSLAERYDPDIRQKYGSRNFRRSKMIMARTRWTWPDDCDAEQEALAVYLGTTPDRILWEDGYYYELPTYRFGNTVYSISDDTRLIHEAVEESIENLFDASYVADFCKDVVPYLSGNPEDYLSPEYGRKKSFGRLLRDGEYDGIMGSDFRGGVDFRKLADDIIRMYGPGHELADYDSDTIEFDYDGSKYYIFRQE